MVKVENLRQVKQGFRVDRFGALGNPFQMRHEQERNAVCDAYETYFAHIIAGADPVRISRQIAKDRSLSIAHAWKRCDRNTFLAELKRIEASVKECEQPILCWCAPKRCHGDAIAAYLETICSTKSSMERVQLPHASYTGISTQMAEHQSEPIQPSETPRKRFFDMNLAELTASAQRGVDQAIADMHQQGVATVFGKDDKVYKEYPDGRVEEINSSLPASKED
jgi:hypothetical protein